VASGGRYDQLLARYGKAQPATGAAIDVENLLWALDAGGGAWRERGAVRFLVAGSDEPRLRAIADVVRAAGFPASTLPSASVSDAQSYASAWSIDVTLLHMGGAFSAQRSSDNNHRELRGELSSSDVDALAAWARGAQKE
jgi:histidyl-tRNA synthetase